MSWKGFQKGVARTPFTLKQKTHHVQGSKDPVFLDTEHRFQTIETQTRRLHAESRRYWDAINKMLSHQIEYSKAIEEIYQPISGRALDPESADSEGNLEGIAACEQYRNLVTELQQLVKPEIEMIETRILRPADELLTITKSIKKMLTKREHKHIDLDRYALALKKLQDKPERSVKEEEKMYKAENDYEIALEEFNYYNELLKDELPKLFALEAQLIKPLFQSFYYMQLNIFYTLFTHMEEMKIPYFELGGDIRETFARKRGDIRERTEAIGIIHFRTGHAKAKLEATRRKYNRPGAVGSPGSATSMPGSPLSDTAAPAYDYGDYSPSQSYSPESRSPPSSGYVREKLEPPRTEPRRADREHCTALYDFSAQNDGDLEFREGDVIEIIRRSANTNDWWTGRIGDRVGDFPGNYVQLEAE